MCIIISDLNYGMFLNPSRSLHIMWCHLLIILPFDQMNLKTLLLQGRCRKEASSFSRFCLAAQPWWCEGGDMQVVDKEGSPGGRGWEVQKWCWCQVQPHLIGNCNLWEVRQDSREEGSELASSHENTKITTNCWTTINQKCWNLPKKISYIQRQRRSHNKVVGGVQSW